jgi:hypothetical protein
MTQQFPGKVEILSATAKVSISLEGDAAERSTPNGPAITLDGGRARLVAGGDGKTGLTILRNDVAKDTVSIGGESGDLFLSNKDGSRTVAVRAVDGSFAGIRAGGSGQTGLMLQQSRVTMS